MNNHMPVLVIDHSLGTNTGYNPIVYPIRLSRGARALLIDEHDHVNKSKH